MATTQLFVELLIVGIGVTIWLGFLLAVFFRLSWDTGMQNVTALHAAAILGIAYVLGILVDRAAWRLFHGAEAKHKEKVFGTDPKPAVDDRERHILVSAPALRDQILYNRSRLRICRSWVLNFALIGVFSGIWAIQERLWEATALSGGALVMSVLAARATSALSRDHYNNLKASFDFLRTEKDATRAG